MIIKKFKIFEESKFKGFDVIDLKYDAPSYKTKPEEQKEFIVKNISKLENKDKIFKLYLDVMNSLASDGKIHDKKISGYIITAFNNHTKTNNVYYGHFEKERLGYIHVELTPFSDKNDIIWNKTFQKAVVFKKEKDANKIKNTIKKEKQYYNYIFKVEKITLNTGYYF
jgi:hypothetical protein